MAERTKIVEDLDFYYQGGPSSVSAFEGNRLVFDAEAGDTLEWFDGAYVLTYATGKVITVPPKWLWMERASRTVKVKE